MTAPTLTAPACANFNEPNAAYQPWCTEHWSEDAVCWAQDIDLRVDPDAEPNRGRITAMLTHNPEPDQRCGGRTANLSLFIDQTGRCDGGVEMEPDEAEVAAHAMLSMVAAFRGSNQKAAEHRGHAETAAAALLARRQGVAADRSGHAVFTRPDAAHAWLCAWPGRGLQCPEPDCGEAYLTAGQAFACCGQSTVLPVVGSPDGLWWVPVLAVDLIAAGGVS